LDNKKAIEVLKTYLHEDDEEGELAFNVAIKSLEKEPCEIKWVPIKEELPPLGIKIIVTVIEHFRRKIELRYPVYYMEHGYREGFGFYFGDSQLLADVSEVVAWMPMPRPYDITYDEWND